MGKDTARPTPEKENAKKEKAGKQEGALKDSDLKDVAGAGLGSYPVSVLHQYHERSRGSGG